MTIIRYIVGTPPPLLQKIVKRGEDVRLSIKWFYLNGFSGDEQNSKRGECQKEGVLNVKGEFDLCPLKSLNLSL